jgi:hypothetical protein
LQFSASEGEIMPVHPLFMRQMSCVGKGLGAVFYAADRI